MLSRRQYSGLSQGISIQPSGHITVTAHSFLKAKEIKTFFPKNPQINPPQSRISLLGCDTRSLTPCVQRQEKTFSEDRQSKKFCFLNIIFFVPMSLGRHPAHQKTSRGSALQEYCLRGCHNITKLKILYSYLILFSFGTPPHYLGM